MRRWVTTGAALAAFIGLGMWWFSPVQVVKRRTASFLSTITLDVGAGRTSRQLATYSLNRMLASEVELDTPTIREANGSFERSELESGFSWLANQAKQTRFEIQEIRSVRVEGALATVDLSLKGLVELPHYRPADGIYDVTFEWIKAEDAWRLARVKWYQAQ